MPGMNLRGVSTGCIKTSQVMGETTKVLNLELDSPCTPGWLIGPADPSPLLSSWSCW